VVAPAGIVFHFPQGLLANARCLLPDAGSLEDNGRIFDAMKIEIWRAWPMLKGDKRSSADDEWL